MRRVTSHMMVHVASQQSGIAESDLLGRNRCKAVSRVRHRVWAALRVARPDLSTIRMGLIFGGRDHSTVCQNLKGYHASLPDDGAESEALKLLIASATRDERALLAAEIRRRSVELANLCRRRDALQPGAHPCHAP